VDEGDAMKATLLGIALLCAIPATAMAAQCSSMQMEIDKQYGKRFDRTATNVRHMAVKAAALCKSGKDADSVKMYQEAMKAGHASMKK
jgi:hypothetical protein